MSALKAEIIQPFYWDNYRDTTVGRYLTERERAFIKRVLDDVPLPRRLLDVSCGSGRMTLSLHEASLQVVGLDLDPVALTAFQMRSKTVPLTMGDVHQLSFADGSFDCIVAIQCFQYFDHTLFLQECNRLLCPDGLLIFEAINRHSYKRVLNRILGRDERVNSSDNLSCQEVLSATTGLGFDIQAVKGYNWVPFDRLSDSSLVDLAATIEQVLRLDYLYRISPWILVAAKKRSSNCVIT